MRVQLHNPSPANEIRRFGHRRRTGLFRNSPFGVPKLQSTKFPEVFARPRRVFSESPAQTGSLQRNPGRPLTPANTRSPLFFEPCLPCRLVSPIHCQRDGFRPVICRVGTIDVDDQRFSTPASLSGCFQHAQTTLPPWRELILRFAWWGIRSSDNPAPCLFLFSSVTKVRDLFLKVMSAGFADCELKTPRLAVLMN